MSGDVQPRKRKDKRKKKDDLGVEEPRGTAAALGEGDVFMHSYHDHGTGGHWCAKIIFFSLLAVLLTLIGLIILENRGLSELEANAVESRYSGVLEGWLEDAPDDDHHDEHTLELKHHDEEEDDNDSHGFGEHGDDEHDVDHEDDDDHDEDEHGVDDHDEEQDEDEQIDRSQEQDIEQADNEEGLFSYSKFFGIGGGKDNDDDEEQNDEDDEQDNDEGDDENLSDENDDNIDGNENLSDEVDHNDDEHDNEHDDEQDDENDDEQDGDQFERDVDDQFGEDSQEIENRNKHEEEDDDSQEIENRNEQEQDDDDGNDDEQTADNAGQDDSHEIEDDDEHDDEDDDHDEELEVEKIEQEASDEEPISTELPALPEEDDSQQRDDDDDADGDDDDKMEDETDDPNEADDDDDDGDDDFLDADEQPVERIVAPVGKPLVEVDEDIASSERPPATLEEEEEYEKQQEELRKEEEAKSSHMWLKLTIGGALLVATHAVVRRATAREVPERGESTAREETPVIDRRMTLIPEEAEPVIPRRAPQQTSPPIRQEVKKVVPVLKSPPKREPSEEHEEPEEFENEEVEETNRDDEKELFSDDEIEEEEIQQKEAPKSSAVESKVQQNVVADEGDADADEQDADADDEVPDDVEIIDDEQLEEELEEEEISDVDDTELLSRLEAKYGRLPETDPKHKDGGNSIDDEWPGEPADAYWRQQLDSAERDLRQGDWSSAVDRASARQLASSARARYIIATAYDRMAEAQKDNRLLSRAITAYLNLLKMNENLSDKRIKRITDRTLDRIQFRGNYLNAEPVYRLLIRRFPNEPGYRNNLTISFLMANRADLAEEVLKETLRLWPNDRIALAHYAFVLKNQHNKNEEAVKLFEKALEGDKGPACEPRFYYHYGDALLLLGRYKEAHEVHKRATKYGHFLSPAQRSLYNVKRLRGRPWWNVEDTPYVNLARALEKSWKEILKEGEAARALYEKEKEGLKERGDWSQLDLFVRGREIPDRCKRAPVTCSIVKSEPAASGCRRGQIKFSAMEPGTHVRPHVGPTNCRLRMHLALSNTKDTYLRVDKEIRQWQEGKVLLFDDSFEHEVWHNGTAKRLILIIDLWHPDLTATERRTLPAI